MSILEQYGYRFSEDGLRRHLARQGKEMTKNYRGLYEMIADHMVVAYVQGRQGRDLADIALFIVRAGEEEK